MNENDKLFNSFNLESAKLLNEGISNTSYLVNNEYVIRIKGPFLDLFNHLENEEKIINQLKDKNFVEEVISYNKNNGTKISKFLPDTTRLSNPVSKEEFDLVADLLLELHHTQISCEDFKPFERISFYKKDVYSEIDQKYEDEIINKTKKLYEKYPLVFCHNDLVYGNLLFKKNKLYLLDYEFAGKNIFLFDIASFISENNLRDETNIKLFLSKYGNINREELETMIRFEDILWYYWSKYLYSKTRKQVYLEIANDKLKYCKY